MNRGRILPRDANKEKIAARCERRGVPRREFHIRGRHHSEILFELRSKDPRDLLQVIWTKVKGITEVDVTAEEIDGTKRIVRDSATVSRSPQLFDNLLAITTRWCDSEGDHKEPS